MTTEAPGELDALTLKEVIGLVYQHTGIRMTEAKSTLLEGRLRRRMKELNLSTYGSYLGLLKNSKEEVQSFVNSVTTNETYFFRTARAWEFFQQRFLPEWFSKHPTRTLRVWSAASSTGEEVYSIAMSCEEFREKHKAFNYQITGSDISSSVLTHAAKGLYRGRSIEKLKESHLKYFEKYLRPRGDDHEMSDALKMRVQFSTHNLFHAPKDQGIYDIIFLRNVLIYFDQNDQEKVLENMRLALRVPGVLVVGESESMSGVKNKFSFKEPLVYERQS